MFDSLIILILKAIYRGLYELYYYAFVRNRMHFSLLKNHDYYRTLGKGRSSFARKTWEFIRDNDFVPRDGLKIGFKLKLIIAAHAAQLSWRLPDEAYDYYDKIIIYREYYQSRVTKKLHKAEVNPGLRLIVFSVRAIHESLTAQVKTVNVMIHEFAHALWLEHLLMHRSYTIFDETAFTTVQHHIRDYFIKLQENQHHFLRDYAFTNEAEFFAVAVENFFGDPDLLKRELPDLYASLTSLFLQDPAKIRKKMANIAR